jgi:hypothetical protein
MTETLVLNLQGRRAPPRVDESRLSRPLQDLFATWRQSLQQEFKGLTAGGEVQQGLFPLSRAGASTRPLVAAAKQFLQSLGAQQRAAVSFPVHSDVWRHWSNIHRNVMRHGLCFAELSDRQVELAYQIMRAGLGAPAVAAGRRTAITLLVSR